MLEDKSEGDVSYAIWEFGKDKRGEWGYHGKVVTSRTDSDGFLMLACVRCKYLDVCVRCKYAVCRFGHVLRYKPCRNFRVRALE